MKKTLTLAAAAFILLILLTATGCISPTPVPTLAPPSPTQAPAATLAPPTSTMVPASPTRAPTATLPPTSTPPPAPPSPTRAPTATQAPPTSTAPASPGPTQGPPGRLSTVLPPVVGTVTTFRFGKESPNVARKAVIQVPHQADAPGAHVGITPAPLPTGTTFPMVLPTQVPKPGVTPLPPETLYRTVIDPRIFIDGEETYDFKQPLTIVVCFDQEDVDQAIQNNKLQWSLFTHYVDPTGTLHWERLETNRIQDGEYECEFGGLLSKVSTLHPNDPADEGGP